MIRYFMSNNIEVRGLRIQNSPQFHMKFDGCEGVSINDIQISSPKLSPNTDGIHLGNTRSVAIHNSVVSNGTIILYIYLSSRILLNVTRGSIKVVTINNVALETYCILIGNETLKQGMTAFLLELVVQTLTSKVSLVGPVTGSGFRLLILFVQKNVF